MKNKDTFTKIQTILGGTITPEQVWAKWPHWSWGPLPKAQHWRLFEPERLVEEKLAHPELTAEEAVRRRVQEAAEQENWKGWESISTGHRDGDD
ncbi:MAG: hypothetical protein QXS54_02940 [Candidatus Methanomethylicaceae archaeon]